MNNQELESVFKLGELFCGPGGIAQGAADASIDNEEYRITHQWATDYDLDVKNQVRIPTFITRFPHFYQGEIPTFITASQPQSILVVLSSCHLPICGRILSH
jgi:hypothetical protein